MPALSHPPSPAAAPLAPGPALGARVGKDGVAYTVWAPDHRSLRVWIRRADGVETVLDLTRGSDGYFRGHDPAGCAGDRYLYEFSDGKRAPDPASRFQPEGVHGPSECVDPGAYVWTHDRQRLPWRSHVIYELHLGAFTPEGTFRSALAKLDHVRALGATAIEIMPVADFPGSRNWGYDGVTLYAPARCYGRPDDLRALIDGAHARGLAVILDVVYNHLGPDGNYLGRFSREYFREDRPTPWGHSFNFDEADCRPVRDFFVTNAIHWIEEYRCDGLRLDATNTISDRSATPILAEIAHAVQSRGGFVTAEDDRNQPALIRGFPDSRYDQDAVWADDFHHQVRVALTGEREAYYGSYSGSPADLARTLAEGWFYSGQTFPFWEGRRRGAPAERLPLSAFITCIENHDQVGNRSQGDRLETQVTPAAFRAASMLLCLNPHPILLFMGQEWAASSPFLFFTDHASDLGRLVRAGRRADYDAGRLPGTEPPPDPQAPATFSASKLCWDEVAVPAHAGILALYQECLRQRAAWVASADQRAQWQVGVVGETVALRCQPRDGPERLLQVALRPGFHPASQTDAFLAPPAGHAWRAVLHSEDLRFGGSGATAPRGLLPTAFMGPVAVLWEAETL